VNEFHAQNADMTTAPKRRLRWYQYSLRSLFVLTVLVAIGGSWFAWKKQQVERERVAAKVFKELGGSVDYNWGYFAKARPNTQPPGPAWLRGWLGDDFFAHVVFLNLHSCPVADADLEHLRDLPRLEIVYLDYTKVTDAGLENLRDLRQLTNLSLKSTKVTDVGLEHLRGMTQLKRLELSRTDLTDDGLERLKAMIQLEYLDLHSTDVTDAGLEHLKDLTQLKSLSLEDTKITDVGLGRLKGMTKLERLGLERTKVTDEGVKKLQEALPNFTFRIF
jgi:hypothetical protein